METTGTGLQGYVDIEFDELVKVFGEPEFFQGVKMQAQWAIKDQDGNVITIYDYKESHPPQEHIHWHVGGRDEKAVRSLKNILKMKGANYDQILMRDYDSKNKKMRHVEL